MDERADEASHTSKYFDHSESITVTVRPATDDTEEVVEVRSQNLCIRSYASSHLQPPTLDAEALSVPQIRSTHTTEFKIVIPLASVAVSSLLGAMAYMSLKDNDANAVIISHVTNLSFISDRPT
jgi:hypothetical protein